MYTSCNWSFEVKSNNLPDRLYWGLEPVVWKHWGRPSPLPCNEYPSDRGRPAPGFKRLRFKIIRTIVKKKFRFSFFKTTFGYNYIYCNVYLSWIIWLKKLFLHIRQTKIFHYTVLEKMRIAWHLGLKFYLKNDIGTLHHLDELLVEGLGRSIGHVIPDLGSKLKSRIMFKLFLGSRGHHAFQSLIKSKCHKTVQI